MEITPNDQGEPQAQLVFHHTDHLTGVNVDTDTDGQVVQLLDYFPYGETRIDQAEGEYHDDYGFTGKELDEETELNYFEARYYDSATGRFISRDTWDGDLKDPQSLNKYSYARNNPLKYTDPQGNFPVIPLLIAAYVGYQWYRNGFGAAAEAAPVSGDINDVYSVFTGWSLYTGNKVSPADRFLGIAAAILPAVTGGELKGAKKLVEEGAEKLDGVARFTQKAISPKFSDEGTLAGKTLDEVAAALKNGSMSPSDLPINYVEVNGFRLVDNNRSAYVLKQAGISEDLWNWQTKNTNNLDLISRIRQKLDYNKLSDFGADSVRITNGRR